MEPLDTIITEELDKLYRFAYRETRDAYRAEDLTQDIVLKAYTAWPTLRDPDRAVPWIWGIATISSNRDGGTAGKYLRKIRNCTDLQPENV